MRVFSPCTKLYGGGNNFHSFHRTVKRLLWKDCIPFQHGGKPVQNFHTPCGGFSLRAPMISRSFPQFSALILLLLKKFFFFLVKERSYPIFREEDCLYDEIFL